MKILEDGKIVSQNGNFTIKVKKKLFLFMVMYFHKVKNLNYFHPQVPLRLTLAGAGETSGHGGEKIVSEFGVGKKAT